LPKDSTRYESRSDSRPASRLAEEPTAPAGDEQAFPTGDWPGRPSGKSQRIWLVVLALVVGVSVLWLSRGTEQVGPVGGPLPETAAEEAPLLSLPAPELEVVATSDPSSPSDFSTPASLPAPAKKKSLSKAKSVSKPRKAPPTKTSEPQALSGSADEFPLPTEAVGSGVVRVVAVGAGGTVAVDGGERRVLNDAIPIRAGRRKLVVRNKSGRVIVRFEIDVSAGDEQQCVWEEAAGTWGLKRGSEPRCRLR
jgi:hypothetical protein